MPCSRSPLLFPALVRATGLHEYLHARGTPLTPHCICTGRGAPCSSKRLPLPAVVPTRRPGRPSDCPHAAPPAVPSAEQAAPAGMKTLHLPGKLLDGPARRSLHLSPNTRSLLLSLCSASRAARPGLPGTGLLGWAQFTTPPNAVQQPLASPRHHQTRGRRPTAALLALLQCQGLCQPQAAGWSRGENRRSLHGMSGGCSRTQHVSYA